MQQIIDGIEEMVRNANQDVPVSEGCPLNRQFVPSCACPQVFHWTRTAFFACQLGVRQTAYIIKKALFSVPFHYAQPNPLCFLS